MKKILVFMILFLALSLPLIFAEENVKNTNEEVVKVKVEAEDEKSTAMLI